MRVAPTAPAPTLWTCSVDGTHVSVTISTVNVPAHAFQALVTADSDASLGNRTLKCTHPDLTGSIIDPIVISQAPATQVTLAGGPGIPLGDSTDIAVTISGGGSIILEIHTTFGTGSATFDDGSISKTLTQSQTVTVVGTMASSTADNIHILAKPQSGLGMLAQLRESVVNVVVSMRGSRTQDQFAADDLGVGNYQSNVGSTLGSFVSTVQSECLVGTELLGKVTPSNYKGMVTLKRASFGWKVYQNSTQHNSALENTAQGQNPNPDTSLDLFLTTIPSASGNVYDLDAPGIGIRGPGINRVRIQFREYAVLGDRNSTKQASNSLYWWTASSCQSNPSTSQLVIVSDVANDNQSAVGRVSTTWNLQP